MVQGLVTYLRKQDPEEISRQHELLAGLQVVRMVLTVVAYGLAVMFLPFWLCAILSAIDVAAETIGLRAMRNLNPAKQLWRYGVTLACVVVAEVCYSFAAALIWQIDGTYSKALAVAMVCLSLMQLTSVRTVHLVYAYTGWSAIVLTAIAGNTELWVTQDDVQGFWLSTACILSGSAFVLSTMRSTHALHLRLVQERTTAQAADQAKGRFLAQMSHELRTPLNAIMGMAEAEMALTAHPDTRQRMEILATSARGLATVLDDVLDMSAISQGRLTIRPGTANPVAEIEATTALFRQSYAMAGLTLALHVVPGLPKLAQVDAQRLRQCLTNLLSNALKFTPHGGAVLRAGPGPQGCLQIELSDTGPGLPTADNTQVFEPFFRGSTTAQGGSGLGLSISRALARAMGGDLVALPTTKGALFRLTVALAPMTDKAVPVPPPAPLNLAQRRILVVDDIATNRLVAEIYLRILGASVDVVDSGAAAISAITAQCPDLVLLDMNMPGLNGPDTVALIRALPEPAASLPVLAMTADVTEAHRTQYLAAGVNGCLTKPMTLGDLQAALARHLGART